MILRLFDRISLALLLLGVLLTFSGGTWIRNSWVKLEIASVDPWIWAAIFLMLVVRIFSGRAPVAWRLFQQAVSLVLRLRTPIGGIVLAGVLLYWGSLSFWEHRTRHFEMRTHAFDVAFVHQPLFFGFQKDVEGRPFLQCDLCVRENALAEHQTWIFVPLSFLTKLLRPFSSRDEVIFLLQVLILGLGISILILSGRKRPGGGLSYSLGSAAALLLIFLTHRGFRSAATWDFREDVFLFLGIALLVSGLTELRDREFSWKILFGAMLALASKENGGLAICLSGVPMAILSRGTSAGRRTWVVAFILLLTGAAMTFATFQWLIPWLAGPKEGAHPIVSRFSGLGSTPQEILLGLLTKPWIVLELFWERASRPAALKYLGLTLAPWILSGVWFSPRAWWWGIPALPGLMMNLLSQAPAQISSQYHYDLIILPYLFVGIRESWVGIQAFLGWERFQTRAAWMLLLCWSISGRWPGGQMLEAWLSEVPSRHGDAQFLHSLDPKTLPGRLATTLQYQAHLGHFQKLLIIDSLREEKPDWILIDWEEPRESTLQGWIWEKYSRGKIVSQSPSGRLAILPGELLRWREP